ncbi:unnamed protein product [Cuscuta epithymum]|uniref:Uncharacterized protein n=1 Tax=Cuscuta epithymum TaxID=186058 RepID=A0AAV0FUH2_9ASTE|nr:unnamed protein product [Cuscuta epithymum]
MVAGDEVYSSTSSRFDHPKAEKKAAGHGKGSFKVAGHLKPAAKAHAAVAATGGYQLSVGNAGDRLGDYTPLPGFTPEQWKTLVSALGNSNISNSRMNGPSLEEADWNG